MILQLDSLYNFDYKDPKTKNLPMWDKHPLVFVLDVNFKSKSFLGLNIHWIPKKYRDELLNDIINIMKQPVSSKAKSRLTYTLLLKPKYRRGLKGVRRYIITRVTNIKSIPYHQWPKVLRMKQYNEDIKINDETMKYIINKFKV